MKIQGLTADEIAARVAKGQVNMIQSRSSRSVGDILRTNILTRFNALILSLAVVVIIIDQSIFNALFGLAMILNSGIGIFQELRAKRVLDRLAILNAPRARVIRGGHESEIPIDQVVLDDVLHLRLGDQVVADGKVLESADMEIDESLLTGESDPVFKRANQAVLSGSIVVAGSGFIRVTAVGADAYSAKITEHAKRFQQTHSELLASTNLLLKWISWMLVIVAPLLIWGQIRIDDNWREAVIHATAAIVGMIPEGLVLLTSMAFMLATMTLARRKVLVQQMPAVEGLARVDMLLLDKTGTLTEGNIRFEAVVEVAAKSKKVVNQVLRTIASRQTSPTNDAIGEALHGEKILQIDHEVPFSSARKWSSISADGQNWLFGAPEILFAGRSDSMYEKAQTIAASGKRVLVLMAAKNRPKGGVIPDNRSPCALVVLSEKIRPDAHETLRFFAEQNVAIKVISGDSPLTVAAVARRVGIDVDTPFDARKLPDDPAEFAKIINDNNVFGRVQPEQKRQIAQVLQAAGHVVAMTGDGVNDALALKDADIGIAMNSGAQATKAVAELILLDNKFSRLPNVLAEGRRVIANIERVANLFVIKNVYSLLLSLAVTVAGLQYPYLPSQMTVISTLTIGIPAFLLALAPNSQRYKPGFLRRVLRFAIPVGFVGAAAMMVNYALVHRAGVSSEAAGTSTSIVIMIISVWVLACLARPLKGWKVWLIVGVIVAFTAVISIPWTAARFEYSVDWATIPWAFMVGAVGAALVEMIWRIDQRNRV